MESVLLMELLFPAASVNLPAATEIEAVLACVLAVGVNTVV